ncbi:exodeoxyribonuclease III, putative [Plasmodium vinckei petteri]|uniref:Exodeoxyribonuclease III, putative n=1 Tax=Plasmodium vinckei petteri TaxID=138298 RepID=A0A6V7T2Z5_PLAVN|nr:exodeoxyribonuclease III, putative [Plasmodium vinckei petteri]
MEKLHIVSWNVNGWKKSCEIIKKNGISVENFLEKLGIDILCLQETKTNDGVIEYESNVLNAHSDKYETYWNCCTKKENSNKPNKGYSGLAIFVNKKIKTICSSRNPFKNFFFSIKDISKYSFFTGRKFQIDKSAISFYLPNDTNCLNNLNEIENDVNNFFGEGRLLITIHKQFIVVNTYIPYSGYRYERLDYKMMFLHILRAKLIQLRISTGLPIILLGDLNISLRNLDVHFLSNYINIHDLLIKIDSFNLKENIKNKIRDALPTIIKTLENPENFIIKKQKNTQNVESYHLFLNYNGNVKKVGSNFTSPEEIYFLFSLDPFYANDKYSHLPKEYYFYLDNDVSELDTQTDSKEPSMSNITSNIDEHNWDMNLKTQLEENNMEWDRKVKENYSVFLSNVQKVREHVEKNETCKVPENVVHINSNDNNVRDKILSSKKILCKYEFKHCTSDGKYMIKKKDGIYLKYLNEIFISLNIILSKEDLINIANDIGYTSPQCCNDFVQTLIYEDNMIDIFSYLYPSMNGKFTCWDMYKQNRITNEGSRIDYIFVDSILFEMFIKKYNHLYDSPIILTKDLEELLKQTKTEKNVILNLCSDKAGKKTVQSMKYIDALDQLSNRDVINSITFNELYANYFTKIKRKTKQIKPGKNMNTDLIYDEDNDDVENFEFQFKLISYIGFIYTSPKLSDHIAVNCTFSFETKNEEGNKKVLQICCSHYGISLNKICTTIYQYTTYLSLFLISPQLFSLSSSELLNCVHTYNKNCSNIIETQPHKKTKKITQYFQVQKKKT